MTYTISVYYTLISSPFVEIMPYGFLTTTGFLDFAPSRL